MTRHALSIGGLDSDPGDGERAIAAILCFFFFLGGGGGGGGTEGVDGDGGKLALSFPATCPGSS